jgi:DNA-binding winged helix-turn-helix (wHTH) protein/Tol biopolymer transport system component
MPSGYRFGDYVLDAQRRTLQRGDREIGIGARAFGVLELLVGSAGRVVTRDELIDGVWNEVAVTDDSLARAISDLRTALGDDASHPRFIRTVHRRGYQFVAPVTLLDEAVSPATSDDLEGRRRLRTPWILVVLVALLVLSALAVRRCTVTSEGDAGSSLPDFPSWNLRALGPSPFITTAIKPAFAKGQELLSVVAPDPDTGVHSIFLLRPDGGEPLQLTRGIEVRGPAPEFTAADSGVLFTSYRVDPELGWVPDIWLAPIPAGEPALLVRSASAASTSPDGLSLVYSAVTPGGTSIRVRHQDGSEVEVAGRGFWPRWSPDGEWIAYATSDPEGGDGTLHVVRPDGSGDHELSTRASQLYGLCWTPDGERVIFASEEAGPSAIYSVAVTGGEPIAVTRGPGGSSCPTMSPDGRSLVFDFDQRRWYLYLAPEPGGSMRRVLVEPGMTAAALSPDGGRIAIAQGAEAQSPAVTVLDVDTRKRRTLSGMTASAVAWWPDGRSLLVAAAAPDGISNWIWRLPAAGGLPEPVLKGEVSWEWPSASPDGTRIAAARVSETASELVVLDLQRNDERVLARGASIRMPTWSPDGRLLAWSGAWRPDDLISGGIWVCPVEGSTPRRLVVDGARPVWEADGEHLLFLRFLEHEGIWRVPVSGGTPSLVYRLEEELRQLSPEGLDIGRAGGPLLLILYRFSGELYALEAPDE